MKTYDPEIPPLPAEWLAIDEQRRTQLIESYHRAKGVKLPNVKLHALFHAIIENQIATGVEPVVRAMARLRTQGLSRHETLHAIASVLTDHFFEIMKNKDKSLSTNAQESYNAGVERLTAKEWRSKYK